MNWSAGELLEMPTGVVTTMCAGPTEPNGEMTVIEVGELTTKPVPGVPPKVAPEAPTKFVPVTVTVVAPPRGPTLGVIEVTVGEVS